jgi:hypothetical protein
VILNNVAGNFGPSDFWLGMVEVTRVLLVRRRICVTQVLRCHWRDYRSYLCQKATYSLLLPPVFILNSLSYHLICYITFVKPPDYLQLLRACQHLRLAKYPQPCSPRRSGSFLIRSNLRFHSTLPLLSTIGTRSLYHNPPEHLVLAWHLQQPSTSLSLSIKRANHSL